jgi:ATP-dependent DNA ligase
MVKTEVESLGLEGIVSKRKNGIYRAGIASGWVKTKTVTWRAANAERWRMFART